MPQEYVAATATVIASPWSFSLNILIARLTPIHI